MFIIIFLLYDYVDLKSVLPFTMEQHPKVESDKYTISSLFLLVIQLLVN